ncbi:sugar ABC transporter ATP-binding protein [Herbiconiux sp.]|uniref:sugar ABC transporter ATP-binding protein n=1 Tax=Herbiconiux sp. TaxID=1871186 RepID=UPI0025B9BA78|nr:sugar ABC transporter ATP-binding protein [Herbiconiux sp.]
MTTPQPALIRVENLVKRFPGVVALDDVTLEIHAGEVLALTGENGSGKSTLSKIVGGLYQPDGGRILVDGVERRLANPHAALEHGIVLISQELTLAPTLTVAENVLLGRLPRRGGAIDWPETRRRAAEVLAELGVHIDVERRVDSLSVELQQEVEIARAISTRARLLILDEATSSLSEGATLRLLDIVAGLSARGVAVLMITHRMPEIYASCSRAVVLRDGALAGEAPLPSTAEHELVRMMVGRELLDYYGSRVAAPAEVVLEVDRLHTADGALKPVGFQVRAGEVLGVAGLVGSGKAELAMALGGAIPARGEVRVAGRPLRLGSPRRAIAAGVGYVPDDRRREALLPPRSVAENISLAWLDTITRFGFVRVGAERRDVSQVVTDYGVKTSSLDKRITLLSGGNQQKAILGRTFARGCPVYVLNEPTRGVDVGSKSAIYGYIQRLAEKGAAIVLISSELPELIGLSDRVAVFHHGGIRAVVAGADLTEEVLGSYAVSGTRPDEHPSAVISTGAIEPNDTPTSAVSGAGRTR